MSQQYLNSHYQDEMFHDHVIFKMESLYMYMYFERWFLYWNRALSFFILLCSPEFHEALALRVFTPQSISWALLRFVFKKYLADQHLQLIDDWSEFQWQCLKSTHHNLYQWGHQLQITARQKWYTCITFLQIYIPNDTDRWISARLQ